MSLYPRLDHPASLALRMWPCWCACLGYDLAWGLGSSGWVRMWGGEIVNTPTIFPSRDTVTFSVQIKWFVYLYRIPYSQLPWLLWLRCTPDISQRLMHISDFTESPGIATWHLPQGDTFLCQAFVFEVGYLHLRNKEQQTKQPCKYSLTTTKKKGQENIKAPQNESERNVPLLNV